MVDQPFPLLIAVVVFSSIAIGTGTADIGQSGGSPSSAIDEVAVSVTVESSTTVDAQYQFTLPSAVGGDPDPQWLNGTMWSFENASVRNLDVWVDDRRATVARDPRHHALDVPVSTQSETVRVRLVYTVESSSSAVHVPLWVPEYTTDGADRAVSIDVTASNDRRLLRPQFPAPDRRSADGSTLHYRLKQVPGFVSLDSGTRDSGPSVRTLATTVGIGLILGGLSWLALAWQTGQRGPHR